MRSPLRSTFGNASTASHVLAVAVLGAVALLWSFPLVTQLSTAIPGIPGDNYGYLWNLWWSRTALDAGADFWWSSHLLHPGGVDLVNHPHTFLQGLVAATLLAPLSVIEAENLYIVFSLFANGLTAYLLAFDITRHSRASLLAALTFASSPYISGRLMGHYDLLTAWVFPAFAFCIRRVLLERSLLAGVAMGVVLSVTAYTAYYYVVYLALFFVTYILAWWSVFAWQVDRRPTTPRVAYLRIVLGLLLAVVLAFVGWVLATGGGEVAVATLKVTAQSPQNPLTIAWCVLAAGMLTLWRVRIRAQLPSSSQVRSVVAPSALMAMTFLVCSAPLIYQAVTLGMEGKYVSHSYHWRSAPAGIDVASLFLGNPLHPLTRDLMSGVHKATNLDLVECVGWLGIVPMVLIWVSRGATVSREARAWMAVGVAAFVWALGPRLIVAGVDVGLPLPELLARFIPVVSNARIPGRAMVVVYLALGIVIACRLTSLQGRWQSAAVQWSLVALLAFDFLNSPMPMTRLDVPRVYQTLAAIPDNGAVCELPFGVGDGLGQGAGYQAREILYYATIHGHPLLGGFVSRLPPGTVDAYRAMPVLGNLLRLSHGQDTLQPDLPGAAVPCDYVVVNTLAASPALMTYLQSAVALEQLDSADGRTLFRVRD